MDSECKKIWNALWGLILYLCLKDEFFGVGFGKARGWVNDGQILILGWTVPLTLASKNLFLSPSFRLTGYGIHHCFARSLTEDERTTVFSNFYTKYYTMGGTAVASCVALCPAVGLMGRRGGLLVFMIITALASLLQLGLLNCERTHNSQTHRTTLCGGLNPIKQNHCHTV